MNKIIPPIRLQDQGPAVANLQEALLFIVEKHQLTPSNLTLAQWQQAVQSERVAQSFGEGTRRLFVGLLTDLHLPSADFVNEPIAERLNQVLETLGAFVPSPPLPSDDVFPLTLSARGTKVAELHASLRQLGYSISLRESIAKLFSDTTHRAVGTFQQSRGLESSGIVDQALAMQINTAASVKRNEPRVVLGIVRGSDATAVEGAVVRAFDAYFRSEELLGEDITDSEGRYSIAFTTEQFARNEKDTADLLVRVFDTTADQVLAESPIVFNAPREAAVDLVVEARRRSEYEKHMDIVEQLAGDVSPADFTANDLSFLIDETRVRGRLLAFLCVAHRHGRETGAPAPAFYGLFRQGLPTNLPALLLTPLRLQRRALERSIKDNVIPAELGSDLDAILVLLERARATHVVAASPGMTLPLSELLTTSGVPSSSLEKFLSLYLERTGRLNDFWDSLRSGEELPRPDVEALQFTLQLALLTRNNVPLVKLLRGQSGSIRDLVRLGVEDWRVRIRTAHASGIALPPDLPGQTEEERIAAYAGDILELLQEPSLWTTCARG